MTLIPAGYLYKKVAPAPDWLNADGVRDICSVSTCISEHFCDYVDYWKHNRYWFFDDLDVIRELAAANGISLAGLTPFFYRVHPLQWSAGDRIWTRFGPEASCVTRVREPQRAVLTGFDVVTYSSGTSAECSPLSCNGLAESLRVNEHCLFERFDDAKRALESGAFARTEPGPYRILEVHAV